jgi:hypothetical protein
MSVPVKMMLTPAQQFARQSEVVKRQFTIDLSLVTSMKNYAMNRART